MKNLFSIKSLFVWIKLIIIISFSIIALHSNSQGGSIIADYIFNEGEDIERYEKFEIDIILYPSFISTGENPYDPEVIDLRGVFVSPDGTEYVQPGFYYQIVDQSSPGDCPELELLEPSSLDPIWKIRFAPNQKGLWNFKVVVSYNLESEVSKLETFNCTDKKGNRGFVRIDNNRYLRFDNGQAFHPVSLNFMWGDASIQLYNSGEPCEGLIEGTQLVIPQFEEFSNHGINHTELDINVRHGIGVVGYDYYKGGYYLNYYNQIDSWRVDKILESAENFSNQLYITLNLFHACNFNYYIEWGDAYQWEQLNPFNNHPIHPSPAGPVQPNDIRDPSCSSTPPNCMSDPYDFYKPGFDVVRTSQYNYLRYVVARWGYSTSVFSFETMNEGDDFGKNYEPPAGTPELMNGWLGDMNAYIEDIDPNNHLVSISCVHNENIQPMTNADFNEMHTYRGTNSTTFQPDFEMSKNLTTDATWATINRPAYVSEYGYVPGGDRYDEFDPNFYEVHNINWTSLFSNMGVASFFWYKQMIEPTGGVGLKNYLGVSEFAKLLPRLSHHNYGTYKDNQIFPNGTDSDIRLSYLSDTSSYKSIYGWMQDVGYTYDHLYEYHSEYLMHKPLITDGNKYPMPDLESGESDNPYKTIIKVKREAKYIIKYYDSFTGLKLDFKEEVSSNSNVLYLTLYDESEVKSRWGDIVFTASCLPEDDWVENLTCIDQWNDVANYSELVVDNDNTNLYYINNEEDKSVCNLYKSPVWEDGKLNTEVKALSGLGLAYNGIDNSVYFVGKNDKKIHKLEYKDGYWNESIVYSQQQYNVRDDSELEITPEGDKIFYINDDLLVCCLVYDNGEWGDYALTYVRDCAASGRGLIYNPLDNSIYYNHKIGKIYKISFYQGEIYIEQASGNQFNTVNDNSDFDINTWGSNIYYINNNRNLCNLYYTYTGKIWRDGIIDVNATLVQNGSNISVDKSTGFVYYIGEDGYIYRCINDGEVGWSVKILHQVDYCQEKARYSIMANNSIIYYVGDDYKIHEFKYIDPLVEEDKDIYQTSNFKEEEAVQYSDNMFLIYPNPVRNTNSLNIKILSDVENGRIEIYNLAGIKQLITPVESRSIQMDISHLDEGVYIVKLITEQFTEMNKLIVYK